MTLVDTEIMELLRCPVTSSKLRFAEPDLIDKLNERIDSGRLADCSGRQIESRFQHALVNQDNSLALPIRAGVISLSANRAISLADIKA